MKQSTILEVCEAVRAFLAPVIQKMLPGAESAVAFPSIVDATAPPKLYVEPGAQEFRQVARDAMEDNIRIGVSVTGYVGTTDAEQYRAYLAAVEEMVRALLFHRFEVSGGVFRVVVAMIDGAPFGATIDGGLYNGEAIEQAYAFRGRFEVTLTRIVRVDNDFGAV